MSDSSNRERQVSEARLKAYSLLKIADAIEEASTCKNNEGPTPTLDGNIAAAAAGHHGLSNISNFMRVLEEEQRSILGLVRSSLSEVASRDSSEIPFDEQSREQRIDSRSPVPISATTRFDARDDSDDQDDGRRRTTRQQQRHLSSNERVQPTPRDMSSLQLQLLNNHTTHHQPYDSKDKRAELSRSLGPYLYSKIHSSQDRLEQNPFLSMNPSASFLEQSSTSECESINSHNNKKAADETKALVKMSRRQFRQQPSLFCPMAISSSSETAGSEEEGGGDVYNDDDEISKVRDNAESTFDGASTTYEGVSSMEEEDHSLRTNSTTYTTLHQYYKNRGFGGGGASSVPSTPRSNNLNSVPSGSRSIFSSSTFDSSYQPNSYHGGLHIPSTSTFDDSTIRSSTFDRCSEQQQHALLLAAKAAVAAANASSATIEQPTNSATNKNKFQEHGNNRTYNDLNHDSSSDQGSLSSTGSSNKSSNVKPPPPPPPPIRRVMPSRSGPLCRPPIASRKHLQPQQQKKGTERDTIIQKGGQGHTSYQNYNIDDRRVAVPSSLMNREQRSKSEPRRRLQQQQQQSGGMHKQQKTGTTTITTVGIHPTTPLSNIPNMGRSRMFQSPVSTKGPGNWKTPPKSTIAKNEQVESLFVNHRAHQPLSSPRHQTGPHETSDETKQVKSNPLPSKSTIESNTIPWEKGGQDQVVKNHLEPLTRTTPLHRNATEPQTTGSSKNNTTQMLTISEGSPQEAQGTVKLESNTAQLPHKNSEEILATSVKLPPDFTMPAWKKTIQDLLKTQSTESDITSISDISSTPWATTASLVRPRIEVQQTVNNGKLNQTASPRDGQQKSNNSGMGKSASLPTTPNYSIQALEERKLGRQMFSHTPPARSLNLHSSKALKLAQQGNKMFFAEMNNLFPSDDSSDPSMLLTSEDGSDPCSISAPSGHTADLTSEGEDTDSKGSHKNGNAQNKASKEKLAETQDAEDQNGRSKEDQTSHLPPKHPHKETDKTASATKNETMLQECLSAIVSLKETSESKYQALESKYLELKGSFSHLETNKRGTEDDSNTKDNFELKNKLLKSEAQHSEMRKTIFKSEVQHSEMQKMIEHLESQNRKLLEESMATRSQNDSLKQSLSQLEIQNRHLREAAVEHDDKCCELQDRTAKLEEQNSQLQLKVQLAKKLESQCQNIEKRCLDLQEVEKRCLDLQGDFSRIEAENMNLKEQNNLLESSLKKTEAKLQHLEESSNKTMSQTDSYLKGKCLQLEESTIMLESDNRLLQTKKKEIQAKYQELEESKNQLEANYRLVQREKLQIQAKCQQLEESNGQLEADNGRLLKEKQQTQSKCWRLEESNSQLQSDSHLIQKEMEQIQAKCQQLAESNNQQEHDNLLLQNEMQQIQVKCQQLEATNNQSEINNHNLENEKQELLERCQLLEDINIQYETDNSQLETEKQQLKVECQQLEESNNQVESRNCILRTQVQQVQAKNHELEESIDRFETGTVLLQNQKQKIQENCQQLEEANKELESEAHQSQREKQKIESKLLALEAGCLVREDTNDQLTSRINVLQDEKHELQSKYEMIESECQELKETNDRMQSQQSQLKEEQKMQLQEMESNLMELQKSNSTFRAQNCDYQDEKLEFQSRIKELESKTHELESANNNLVAENQKLECMKDHLQSNLESIESKSSELERSNENLAELRVQMEELKMAIESKSSELQVSHDNLAAQKTQIQELKEALDSKSADLDRSKEIIASQTLDNNAFKEDFERRLQGLESKCLELEQANCYLKSHNMKLEDINRSLRAMQASLEGSLRDARTTIKDLTSLNHLKNRTLSSQQISSASEVQSELGSGVLSCISTESDDNEELGGSKGKSGYQVVSSQDLHTYSLSVSSTNGTGQGTVSQSWDANGIVALNTDKEFEEQLREKLNQLAISSSYEEEEVDVPDTRRGPQHTVEGKQEKQTVESAMKGEGSTLRQPGGKQSGRGTQSPRPLPPLSPRPPPSPRPPLPPNTSKQSNRKESEQLQQNRNDQRADELQSGSTDSTASDEIPVQSRKHPPSPTKEKRGNSSSIILHHHIHNPNDDEVDGNFKGRQEEVPTNKDSHLSPTSRRSRKSKRYEESEAPLSPNSRRSRKSGRHQEPRQTKPSSSQVMATLFGCNDIPDYVSTDEHEHAMVLHHKSQRGAPMIPCFLESRRSPLRRRPGDDDSPDSSVQEESNSIVTQTTTQTRDLLNATSRKEKKTRKNSDKAKSLVKSTSNYKQDTSKGTCDCLSLMPPGCNRRPEREEDEVRGKTHRAGNTGIGIHCDSSGCGVDAILPAACSTSSHLARRTWNYGKKQSRAVTSGQHLMISNSAESSIQTVTSIPTASTGTATILAGTITTHRQGPISSFDTNNATSEDASTASSKFHGSSILAKRDKLVRRKQTGQNQNMLLQSGSSSSWSERDKPDLKPDKKIPLRPLSGGGHIPFL